VGGLVSDCVVGFTSITKLKLVDPPVAESVTGAVPTHAVEAMLNVAVAELPFDVTLLKLRPGQVVESETLHKLLPDSVTTTLPPCAASEGLTAWILRYAFRQLGNHRRGSTSRSE